jgi:hypothetical protein
VSPPQSSKYLHPSNPAPQFQASLLLELSLQATPFSKKALASTETGKVNAGTVVAGQFASMGGVEDNARPAVAVAFASTASAKVDVNGVMGLAFVSIESSKADALYVDRGLSQVQVARMASRKRRAQSARHQSCGLALSQCTLSTL